jgi:large subunit ribosomal protein L29
MRRKEELQDLRELSFPGLEEKLTEARRQLFENRIRFTLRALDHPGPLRSGKRKIARIKTLLREAELAAEPREKGNGKRKR